MSEKTGLIEIEGTVSVQDDQENTDNNGLNNPQSDAMSSSALEDRIEENEGQDKSRNGENDELLDVQPGTSAQSFGHSQEHKHKGNIILSSIATLELQLANTSLYVIIAIVDDTAKL